MIDVPTLTAADIAAIQLERVARGHQDRLINADVPPVASVRDLIFPQKGGLPCRLYVPVHSRELPLLIYLHGGGWSFGSIDSHDRFLRQLAVYGQLAILSVGYRLAPEYPYPTARDDVIGIMHGLSDHAILPEFGDCARFLGGDSAGAHIALSAAMELPRGMLNGLILFYGAYRPDFTTLSYRTLGRGDFGLTTERMQTYWSAYLHATPRQCRLEADLLARDPGELPDVYMTAAECDPLLSDSLDLAMLLDRCRLAHQLQIVKGACHGYLRRLRDWAAVHEHLSPAVAFIERRSRRAP